MAHLLIIRGLPGSGKSTFAKSLGRKHFEADMWMVNDKNEYEYNSTLLSECHEACLYNVKKYLDLDYDVVVSNTFSHLWEMQPYIDLGYPHTIVMMDNMYNNVHSVPDDIVQKMRDRWEFAS